MLLPMLIDAEALEVDIPPRCKLWFHRPGDVDGALETQVLQAVLEDLKVDGDDARHLYRATEGYLAVALGEVQVTDRELGPGHVHGQVDLGAAGQVLDVAVPAVLGPPRYGPRTLPAYLLSQAWVCGAGVVAVGLRRHGDVPAC